MLVGEQVIGMISLDKQQPNFYTETDAHVASAYAAQAAIAVENARLYQQAQQEIAERKRVEAELNAYHERLEHLVRERTAELEVAMAETSAARDRIDAILRSVADGLIVTDLEHKVILANPAAESLLELSLEKMLGYQLGVGLENDELHQVVKHTWEQKLDSYEADVELTMGNRPKKVIRARTALVGVQHGQPLGTVTVLQDVTRVREVDRLKTELLDTVAHELRTPLTSILGFSEILLTRSLDQSRRRRYLQMINEQSTHLSEIVDNLLDVSRLGSGRGLDLNLQLVDIGELMAEVVMSFAEIAAEYDIRLEGLEMLPLVMGDSFRLAQVGRNLLSNALKYSPEGGTINIGGRVKGDYVEISVQDPGIGMTPEQQLYLFEPFYRVDTSNTAVGGAGLGLAISKLVVGQHGGEIWLESEWGVGTTVYFTLPTVDG
jgi:PAS domain S-box-containing protein